MTKKKMVWVLGGVAVLLGLGAWYAVGVEVPKKSADDDFEIVPTKWSQEGDYAIREVNGRTVVENTAAGFSFMVPEGWKLKTNSILDKFSLEILNENTRFAKNNFFEQGCRIFLETVVQKNEATEVVADINELDASSNERDGSKVVYVDEKKALQKVVISEQSPSFSLYGENIGIDVPVSDTTLLSISTQAMPDDRDRCREDFQNFFESIAFE